MRRGAVSMLRLLDMETRGRSLLHLLPCCLASFCQRRSSMGAKLNAVIPDTLAQQSLTSTIHQTTGQTSVHWDSNEWSSSPTLRLQGRDFATRPNSNGALRYSRKPNYGCCSFPTGREQHCVPAGCTNQLQPLDLSLNKPAKQFLHTMNQTVILLQREINSVLHHSLSSPRHSSVSFKLP